MNRIVVGVDIAKRVFQLHWVEPADGRDCGIAAKAGEVFGAFC